MITEAEIIALGFEYSNTLSTDEINTYLYVVDRLDKPQGSQNVYRLDRLGETEYFELVSDLERLPEFKMFTRGFNGELEEIDELSRIFDLFKIENLKI